MVQFYPRFKFYFPLFLTHNIIHYHTLKQREMKIKPSWRIKLNHNTPINVNFFCSLLMSFWIAWITLLVTINLIRYNVLLNEVQYYNSIIENRDGNLFLSLFVYLFIYLLNSITQIIKMKYIIEQNQIYKGDIMYKFSVFLVAVI